MKKKYLLILFLSFLLPLASVAQNNNCNQPIADFLYQQQLSKVTQSFNDAERLNRAKLAIDNYCLSSFQIKGLAETFRDDDARLEFAKLAYIRVFDKQNFYEVYNAFAYFSTVFRLHDFVLEQRNGISNPLITSPTNNPNSNPNFPNLIYPNYAGYQGASNCGMPMDDHDFNLLAQDVLRLTAETGRLNRLSTIGSNYCLSTEQAMKFASLLENEDNRLLFLKNAYNRVFDLGNYRQAGQLFRNRTTQDQFIIFMNSRTNIGTLNNQGQLCEVNASDYNEIKIRVGKISFDNERLNTIKSIMRVKKCFTVEQVKDLAPLFRFTSGRVEFVKFAYDYTKDVDNFYKLTDVFTFSSDKAEILNFIETKR
jgi:hypothetical protein